MLTGASDHHFLAVEKVRGILGGFFGRSVSPGLYLPSAAFVEGGGALRDESQQLAELHGRAWWSWRPPSGRPDGCGRCAL